MNQRISILLLALYWVAMAVGTHVPAEYIPPAFSWADKVYHFVTYAGLAFLIVNAFGFRNLARQGTRTVVALIVLLVLYGAIDELTQTFIPSRHASMSDWFADCLGGILGVVVCWSCGEWFAKWRPKWRVV